MQGTIFDIQSYSLHNGDGIRTTVFFKGCPLRCAWCHNPEGLSCAPQLMFDARVCVLCGLCERACPEGVHRITGTAHEVDRALCTACARCVQVCPKAALAVSGRRIGAQELADTLLADKPFYDESGGGVTLSGGEPLMQGDFAAELLRLLKGAGVHTLVQTSGYAPKQVVEKAALCTDAFMFDIKLLTGEKHKLYTGVSNEVILNNARFLAQSGKTLIIRTPVIGGVNDDDTEMEAILRFVASLGAIKRYELFSYHAFGTDKYAKFGCRAHEFESVSAHRLEQIARHAQEYGIETRILK